MSQGTSGSAAAATAVESHAFDGGLLAHNPATGALCLLNGIAGEALALMRQGHGEATAAGLIAARYRVPRRRVAEDLAGLAAAWRRAGLLAAPAPRPPDEPAPAVPELAKPPFEATVSCGGPALRLRCEEPALAALIAEVLRPALTGEEPAAGAVELAGAEGGYRCWHDGRLLWRCVSRPLARRSLLREAIVRTLPDPPAALIHASAIAMDGRAAALAGDSGSGKTTLAAALVGQGARLVADDLLPLLADGRLAPVPLALSLKAGSWPLLAGHFPALQRLPVLESRELQVRYLWPGAERAAAAPVPPAAILFPARRAAPGWRRLSPRQCLERLIDTGTHLEAAPGALAALAHFAEATPAFILGYHDLANGAAAVDRLLRTGAPA